MSRELNSFTIFSRGCVKTFGSTKGDIDATQGALFSFSKATAPGGNYTISAVGRNSNVGLNTSASSSSGGNM